MASLSSASASNDEGNFWSLSHLQRDSIESLYLKLEVVGSLESQQGLLFEQSKKIERALRAYENLEPYWKKEVAECFSFSQNQTDWTYRIHKRIESQPQSVAVFYKQIYSSLPDPSFEKLRRVLLIELQRLEYQLTHPFFSYTNTFPGSPEFDIQSYVNDLQLNADQPAEEFLQEALSYENFNKIYELQQLSGNSLNDYLYYLSFGSYQVSDLQSIEDLKEKFLKAALQAEEVSNTELQSPYLVDLDFYWEFAEQIKNLPSPHLDWKALWEWTPEKSENLNALLWFEKDFSDLWEGFQEYLPLSDLLEQENKVFLKDFLFEIDDFVAHSPTVFDGSQVKNFQLAMEQIKNLNWLKVEPQDSAYLELEPELRNILVVRLFPFLDLQLGRALLEGRLLDLPSDRLSRLGETLYESPARRLLYFNLLGQLNLRVAEQQRQLHEEIVADLLAEQEPAPTPTDTPDTVTLLNGRQIPSLESERALLREKMESEDYHSFTRDQLHFPMWAERWVKTTFFPEPHHFERQVTRFENELTRQQILKDYQNSFEALGPRPQEPEALKKWSKKDRELRRLLAELTLDENGFNRTDFTSGAVYFAGFADGFGDRKPQEIALNIGVGLVFYYVFKGVGKKWAFRIIIGDTAVRVLSAHYYDPNSHSLFNLNMDLEKGFSLPYLEVGKWTAESVSELYQISSLILFQDNPHQKLEGYHRLGRISSEFFWFGVGNQVASALGGYRFGFLRNKSRLETKRNKLLKNTRQMESDIGFLAEKQTRLQTELQQTPQRSKRASSLRAEILDLQHQLLQLRSGLITQYQGPLGFYLRQGLRVGFQIVSKPYLLFLKSSSDNSFRAIRKRISLLRRSRNLGLAQLESRLQAIDSKIRQLETRYLNSNRVWTEISNASQSIQKISRSNRFYETKYAKLVEKTESLQQKLSELEPSSAAFQDEAKLLATQLENLFIEGRKIAVELRQKYKSLEELQSSISERELMASERIAVQLESKVRRENSQIAELEIRSLNQRFLADEYMQASRQLEYLKLWNERLEKLVKDEDALVSEAILSSQRKMTESLGKFDRYKSSVETALTESRAASRQLRELGQKRSSLDRVTETGEILKALEKAPLPENRFHFENGELAQWWSKLSSQILTKDKLPKSLQTNTTTRIEFVRVDGFEIYRVDSQLYFGRNVGGEWRLIQRLLIAE